VLGRTVRLTRAVLALVFVTFLAASFAVPSHYLPPVDFGIAGRLASSAAAPLRSDSATAISSPTPGAQMLNWSLLPTTGPKPPPRISGGIVWDSTDGYGLMFGGEYVNSSSFVTDYYNDTWTYLGGHWTNATTDVAPSPRLGMGLADDPADHEVVLFGGEGSHALYYLNDTWVWNDSKWTNITASAGPAPPAGFWMSMAYDPAISSVLLFGGINHTSDYGNDTWSFHGGKWTQLLPANLPPGRHAQEMAYDVADGEMVMFGGLGRVDYLNDTWTYSAGNWAPIGPGNHPTARAGPGVVYDAAAGSIVLYGGNPAGGDYYSTWLFAAGKWAQNNLTWNPPNPASTGGQIIFDPTDGYVFLFYEVNGEGPLMENWTLRITSGPPPVQATLTAAPASLVLGQSTTFTTSASGGTGIFTYAYSTLPSGCTSANSSQLACTPSATGKFVVGVNVTDPQSGHAAAVTTLVVSPATIVLTANLAANPSTVSINGSTTLTVTTSGDASASLTYVFSALPPGCTSTDSATLACVPTMAGMYHPQVEVHDEAGHFANASTTLTVTPIVGGASSSSDLWIWIVVAVIIVAVIALVVAVLRRRKKSPPEVLSAAGPSAPGSPPVPLPPAPPPPT
jgi:Galactose oxidase, central domain